MSLKNVVLLVDVDNTLIDTDGIRSLWRKDLGKKFEQAYEKAKESSGFLDVNKIAKILSIDKAYFYKTPFRKFLYPNSLKSLEALEKIGKVIIFSLGDSLYQKEKIQNSGIEKSVGKNNIILVKDKNLEIKDVISKLANKYSKIIIIDDRSDILESATLINHQIITVWMKQGKYKDILPTREDSITYHVNSLSESLFFLKSHIETLNQKNINIQISIIRGIYEKHIKQLIIYTKRDRLISRFTHDEERFKNRKSFNFWLKHKKTIFTLVDSNQNMLGIVWIAKEKFGKHEYTFAIRTYPPARGKGLAVKFMQSVFSAFDPDHKKTFWLSTKKENLIAKNIYKKFGFKEIETNEDSMIMAK